jgi:methionine synthase II (cobalamin-independent)
MFATLVGPYPDDGVAPDVAVRDAITDQIMAGIALLSDGRPAVPVRRPEDVDTVVAAWRSAEVLARAVCAEQGLAPLPVKARIVGPYTAGHAASGDRVTETMAGAELTAAAVDALIVAGAPVVQIDEDRLVGLPPDGSEHRLAADALGRAAGTADGHLTLAVTGGPAGSAGAPFFYDLPFASYLFDLIAGPDDWRLIAAAPGDRGIVCGAADARDPHPDDEAVLVWAARYAASLRGRGPDRVGLAPSAGLERLPREAARRKLERLAAAAHTAGAVDAVTRRRLLDPRAVDARSAALGRYDPEARRPRPPRPGGR